MNHVREAARARFRSVIALTAIVAIVTVIVAMLALWLAGTPMPAQMIIFIGVGIFATVLLGGTLMGLAYLSANSGHDDSAR